MKTESLSSLSSSCNYLPLTTDNSKKSRLEGVQQSLQKIKQYVSDIFKEISQKLSRNVSDIENVIDCVPDALSIPNNVVSGVRNITKCRIKYLGIVGNNNFLGCTQVFAVIRLPLAIYNIKNAVADFFKKNRSEKVDAVLNVTSEVGSVGDVTATFVSGLQTIGIVAGKALSWITTVGIVSTVLEVAGMIFNIKGISENRIVSNKFTEKANLEKTADDYTLEDYEEGLKFLEEQRIENSNFINKHFGMEENTLAERLVDIEFESKKKLSSENPEEVKEGKQMLFSTMKSLRDHIITKDVSHALSLLAGTVSVVGFALLFVPPVIVVGFALAAFGAAISLTKFVYDKVQRHRFENCMEINHHSSQRRFIWIAPEKTRQSLEPFKLSASGS
jgi:hypothetical protein